jgi:hypothetical protein
VIDAYGAGGFKFAGMGHIGSILATPGGVTAISANTMAEVTVATFAPLLAELKASPSSVEFCWASACAPPACGWRRWRQARPRASIMC